ncbi:hypothetical protein LCI18_012831 [Fusarium solani-melongenae]|uniref:Uncharacterized protein n=1 Tax=Fusarium solani subsp. cucurbitae TaxID=2747967 RepID=A0ACD3ZLB8_FUSSC|nr:hypothetical protein LCI18_012831 [Fusarium solani-melongenae]
MSRPQLLPDGLWRCLRPALEGYSLPRTLNSQLLLPTQRAWTGRRSTVTQCRRNTTKASGDKRPSRHVGSLDQFFQIFEPGSDGQGTISKGKKSRCPVPPEERYRTARGSKNPLLREASPHLDLTSTEAIVEALRVLRAPNGRGQVGKVPNRHKRVIHLVKFLVSQHDYPLDAFVYECMMDTLVDPKGSARGVDRLLDDMARQNIPPTPTLCYSALQALAIHPDYVVRQRVIEMMQSYWFEFTRNARQNIIVGMLREGQHELALSKFEEFFEQEGRVELWVYDAFIIEFGRVGLFDGLLEMLKKRRAAKGTDDAFRSLLYHTLDVFSQAYHHEGTVWAWTRTVRTPMHNPSVVTLDNVLGTAARHGDMILAQEVINILRNLDIKISKEHYEALIEASIKAGNLGGAFQHLSAMEQAGLHPDRGSTRTIYKALRENPERIETAVGALEENRGNLSAQAISVTMEAMAQERGTEAAMPLYRDFAFLSGKNPDHFLFRDLLMNTEQAKTRYTLAKDYSSMFRNEAVSRDTIKAYDVMILACLEFDDLNVAFRLASRVITTNRSRNGEEDPKLWRWAEWARPLVKAGLEVEDNRVWPIVDALDQGDDGPAKMVRLLLSQRRQGSKGVDRREKNDTSDTL